MACNRISGLLPTQKKPVGLREQADDPPPRLRDFCRKPHQLMAELRKRKLFAVSRLLVRACGADCAILLIRLIYWLDLRSDGVAPRAGVQINGVWHIANTHATWAFQTGLTARQVRAAIAKLKRKKFIKTVVKRFKKQPTLHMTPLMPAVCDAVDRALYEENLSEERDRQDYDPDLDVDSLDN